VVNSAADLVQALRSVRLLRGNQQEELDTLRQSFPEPRALARELMQRNWLTPFQVNQVFQGRERHLVLGPYTLVERVGEGGMGTVYKARHQLMDRVVALKVIRKAQLGDEESVRRFHREIRAAAQLQHPNIVMAYDADHVGDVHFLVMEFVEGTDLGKVVRKQGPPPVAKACDYIRQALLGLEHAHEKGMVHRDLKPGNLLLSKGGVVKILDMGLARLSQSVGEQSSGSELTREGSVMGTPDYIAPEQAEESHTVDIRADIYSLGCSLYHLLTGQVPFPGGTLAQKLVKHLHHQAQPAESLRAGLPAGLGQVVRRMMAKKPGERYQTPAEAAAALAPFCHELPAAVLQGVAALDPAALGPVGGPPDPFGETLTMPPTSGPAPASLRTLWRSRRARLVLAGVAGALVLLLLAVWLLRPSAHDHRSALERLAWENIPAGDRFDWQPKGLVAVLGQHRVRVRGGNSVNGVAISHDGKLAAAAGQDGLIHLFDPQTLRERHTLGGHQAHIRSVAFSPDGRFLASGGGDTAVLIWDVKARKLHKRCEGHTAEVRGLAFAADGTLLSASYDKTLRLWSPVTGKLLKTFTGHKAPVFCVALSPDGQRAFSGGGETDRKGAPVDCAIHVWDVQTGAEVRRLDKGFRQPVMSLSLSKDGSRLLSGSHDGVRLWETSGSQEPKLLNNGTAKFVALSPDGRLALTSSDSGSVPVRLWDIASARNLRSFPVLTSPSLAFLPDNRTALFAHGDTVRGWDTEGDKELAPSFGHTAPVTDLSFAQDGYSLLSGGADRTVRLWDLDKVRELHVLAGHQANIASVALAPSGQYALSCSDGNHPANVPDPTRLWDVGSGKEVRQLKSAPAGVTAVAFSPDEEHALAPAEPVKGQKNSEYGFALWDVENGTQILRFDGHTNTVTQLGFFLDGMRAFSCSRDGTVRLWEAETGKELEKVPWGATRVVFTDDGSRAYTGHPDGTVQSWDRTETPYKSFAFQRWHEGAVHALALSPDSTLLASAAADGRVVLWDLKKSQKIGVWPPFEQKDRAWPQPDAIGALAFAPDGRHLALGNNNGTIYLIRLEGLGKGLEPRRPGGQ
jgi:WD40 repeat protein/serine/threonine protein kinase